MRPLKEKIDVCQDLVSINDKIVSEITNLPNVLFF